tara:strand:- start:1140 stop:3050 length:1911 start_codon:yes stop_codon:yes gene_type:complete
MKLNNILFIVLIVIIICLFSIFCKKKIIEGLVKCADTACRATGNLYTNIGSCPNGFEGVACSGDVSTKCKQKGRAAGCVPIKPKNPPSSTPPTIPDISGKWYGLDLMGGAVNITQNGNNITATYGAAFDFPLDKIVDEGDGTGTIDGDKITFKWKNSDTPMTGKILIQDKGLKYDYHNFGFSWGRIWPANKKQNLAKVNGTLDQCYTACDKNRLCTGFNRTEASKPSSSSAECEFKTNSELYGYKNALYLDLNTPIPGMVWGYGCNAPDGKTLPNGSFCQEAKTTDAYYYGKLNGTGKPVPSTVLGIQWNNRLNTTWTRKPPTKPQFPFPQGYINNQGTCGVSEKSWEDLSKKYYFKHDKVSQDLGDKTNAECAKACNDDDECYAFENINTIQPSSCKLFFEKVTQFGSSTGNANMDKAINDNTSCYVKENDPPFPPPKIITPKGYKDRNGCCAPGGSVWASRPKGKGAEIWSDKYITKYSSKTASECASICNNDSRCGAFSINRTVQPSECTIWPLRYEAAPGIAYGEDEGCQKQKSCYTKIIPPSYFPALNRIKGLGKFTPPIPEQTFIPPKPPALKPIPEPDPSKPKPPSGPNKPQPATINPLLPGQKGKVTHLKYNFNNPLPISGEEAPSIP